MSERVFGTEKVDDIIGLKDRKAYDKIDIYVDIVNHNNLWGMLYYTEYKKNKPIQKQELIRFYNHEHMREFIETNFNGYELNHIIDMNHRKLFFHYIDYCNIDYYLHEGKPDLNYISLNYRELVQGHPVNKTMPLPREYEGLFDEIIRISKGLPLDLKKNLGISHTIDVYDEEEKIRKAMIHKYTLPMEEFLRKAGEKLYNIREHKIDRPKLTKKLTMVMSIAAVGALLAGGYKLVTDNIYNSDYLVQKNPIKSSNDLKIYANKGNAGKIIAKMMHNDYESITSDDLDYVTGFIRDIDDSNYDNNSSFNEFSYSSYFEDKLLDSIGYNTMSDDTLEKVERMYQKSFYIDNGNVHIIPANAKEYVDYVASLTFMYDAYHSYRPSTQVPLENNDILKKTASTDEINMFNNYPPILRYIMLVQLRGVIVHTDYTVTNKPSYYFGGTSKEDILRALDNKIASTLDEIYLNCELAHEHKSI